MQEISLKDLLEAGCHFGHQVPKSNPKAREFIYTARDNVQIIDLTKTKEGLEKGGDFIKEIVAHGGKVVFVGTKNQARSIVSTEAKRCGVFFMVKRWIGGLLTNWEEVRKNLKQMEELRENLKSEKWTKKEKVLMEKRLRKMGIIYGGIEGLSALPQVLYIVDTHKEEGALSEAIKRGVQVVGIVDTNANPEDVDYPIPANDDAVKSIQLITAYIADAVLEGQAAAQKMAEEAVKEEKKALVKEEKKSKAATQKRVGSGASKKANQTKD